MTSRIVKAKLYNEIIIIRLLREFCVRILNIIFRYLFYVYDNYFYKQVNAPCFYSVVPNAFHYAIQHGIEGSISEALHIMTR